MLFVLLQLSSFATHAISIGAVIAIIAIINIILYRRFTNKFSQTKINEALKEKGLLKQLFNNMPDRIYFKDRESRFIIANHYVSSIMGVNDPEKLIGKTDFDFYDEKYAKKYFEDEQRIMSDGVPMIAKEEKGLNTKGEEIYISTTKIPIKDTHNKVIGIIGIGRDISPQKKVEDELRNSTESLKESNVLREERQEEIQQMAEELNAQAENLKEVNHQLEHLSLVASKTENAVVIMDGNGNFEWVNEGFQKKYEMDMEAFTKAYGSNLRENSSNDSISAILNQIYITNKPYTYNSKFTNKSGKVYWNQSNISPILNSNKEITNLILIDSDITEIKNAEQQISLQREAIELQAIELRKINATKDRLFSIIAHDLKNPFHSILGFTDLLRKKFQTIERDKLNEYLGMINDSTSSAYQLLENLLEWARTQTNNVHFKPATLNLHALVEEVISLQSLHASNKKIVLKNEIDENLLCFADPNMLKTVIRNLASNAIKYTTENGLVTFGAVQKEKNALINISDSGIGISEERQKHLFVLEDIESSAGTSGEVGTGLGLIVCAEFMKINNGNITVKSIPGEGSIFTISLPLN